MEIERQYKSFHCNKAPVEFYREIEIKIWCMGDISVQYLHCNDPIDIFIAMQNQWNFIVALRTNSV
jgi:hypothetical protein